MKRFKRILLTVTALAALAVGGAAFAQAQNAGTVTQTTLEKKSGAAEVGTPGDPADAPSAEDRSEADGPQAGEQEDGTDKADKPDAASERDNPEGPNDPQDSGAQED